MRAEERRRHSRLPVSLPVKAEGHDPDGTPWLEVTTSSDASPGGVSVALKHPVRVGQVLHLSLPLPMRFRASDHLAPAYRVYALVRTVQPGGRVGVVFLGKNPPRNYDPREGAVYLMAGDARPTSAVEHRKHPRRQGTYFLVLKRLAEGGAQREEATVAENLSAKGAAVRTTLPIAKGQVVMVEEVGGSFYARAEVRNLSRGRDGVMRANLMFLDVEAPSRMLDPPPTGSSDR